ncbi:hypothetical protein CHS0354_027710 [Potamilus streckersoni]|uniref:Uncharacterized protein n=1 Tax=Potamilus streckersoni TaxID=2493646 RepID=A0AAE0RMI0_9BIVA|nr:hypothetical protein CHS0354_027710 [Potamilus streckersoni]
MPMDIPRMVPETEKNMRRYFSHIIYGIDDIYKGINDPDIRIHVKIGSFVILKTEVQFPHNASRMHMVSGVKMIDATPYLTDFANLEFTNPFVGLPEYDDYLDNNLSQPFVANVKENRKRFPCGGQGEM